MKNVRRKEKSMHPTRTYPLKRILKDVCLFSQYGGGLKFRSYQVHPARAIVESVLNNLGRTFVVLFPRQSGKNELQAQIECYLLMILSNRAAEIVKISPTWKPQTVNAMLRLERVLKKNLFTGGLWVKESGYILRVGDARIYFFSGGPEANIVGATASTLLEVDEAQDIRIDKYDKDIAPMAASTNATRVFWGTAWTSQTLLARELRAARQAEALDGARRVYHMTAEAVSAEVPAYASFVKGQIALLGRDHPMVKTQLFSEEIDAEGGMFPPVRQTLMRGSHSPQNSPVVGRVYALLLDVAGEDENASGHLQALASLHSPRRDATALSVVEIDFSTCREEGIQAASYRLVCQQMWTGRPQVEQFMRVKALAELWRPACLVVDATGVGAGLASFLDRSFPGRVTPFTFTSASKSELGWKFLSICDTGRFKTYLPSADEKHISEAFWKQVQACQYTVLPGPAKTMRWGVPDGSRDPASGEYLHDDLLVSAALVGLLDEREFALAGASFIVPARDPLRGMDKGF
jgi:hypothetical protein